MNQIEVIEDIARSIFEDIEKLKSCIRDSSLSKMERYYFRFRVKELYSKVRAITLLTRGEK